MSEIHIAKTINNDLSNLQLNNISFLAALFIISEYDYISFNLIPLEKPYFSDEMLSDNRYKELTEQLFELSQETNNSNLLPLGQSVNLELIIKTDKQKQISQRLQHENLLELKKLGTRLGKELKLISCPPIDLEEITRIENQKKETLFTDEDTDFEDKLLYYYFAKKNNFNFIDFQEKLTLITLEQREKILEQLFCQNFEISLSKKLKEHFFCSIELVEPFYKLKNLLLEETTTFFLPDTTLGYSIPEELNKLGKQEKYTQLAEEIKQYFKKTNNPYIIPLTFNSRIILHVTLSTIEKLKLASVQTGRSEQNNSEVARNIIQQVEKKYSFLKQIKR